MSAFVEKRRVAFANGTGVQKRGGHVPASLQRGLLVGSGDLDAVVDDQHEVFENVLPEALH